MSKAVALVTGARGEMGRLLLPALAGRGFSVVALDLAPLDGGLREHCVDSRAGDVLDAALMAELFDAHRPDRVYHLAAVLSATAERDPMRAHRVNVQGTLGLLDLCHGLAENKPVKFAFPSSIAVYGLPDASVKNTIPPVNEWEHTEPGAVYGCNKLYCELMGSYLSERSGGRIDFRSLRFPGLLSADSLPTGGTTDYAPAMVHAAAQGEPYSCFVAENARLPFMTMPDAIAAFERLMDADPSTLTRRAYNARGFANTAGEIDAAVREVFPKAEVRFEPVAERQAIVDSWPADVDDTAARADWGFTPKHDLHGAIHDYLAPALRLRYAQRAER